MAVKTNNLPAKPGVYIFKDKTGKILYIGKARALKNRVRSYFQKNANLSVSKRMMVRIVEHIETIITNTENEALLLEANLIKRHQPAYNIALKDGKKFLYIKITVQEPFPRVFTTRNIVKDRARYFGPYTSGGYVRYILRILRRLFPHRNFQNEPPKEQLKRLTKRYPELFGPLDKKPYAKNIQNIIQFLEGRFTSMRRLLEKQMEDASAMQRYEEAATHRNNLEAVKRITERQQVVSVKRETYDLLGMARNRDLSAISLLFIREGKLIGKQDFTLANTKDEPDEQVIRVFLEQYYPTSPEHVRRVYLPFSLSNLSHLSKLISIDFLVAQRGAKRRLSTMASANAEQHLLRAQSEQEKKETQALKALIELTSVLNLSKPPERIECYDISNIQGAYSVGSMVVFTDGEPAKKEYRKFKIRTITGSNDPAMIAEVLDRRFAKKKSSWKQPSLIMLDGGKGQLSTVRKKLGKRIKGIPIVALAKREEELFIPNKTDPLLLPKGSAPYHLIQRIRDEAHRFAIGYYRKRHEKSLTASALDDISGIGPTIRKKLLASFGSIEEIKRASIKELTNLVGRKRATQLKKLL